MTKYRELCEKKWFHITKTVVKAVFITAVVIYAIPSVIDVVEKLIPILKEITTGKVSLSVIKDQLRSLGFEGVVIMFVIQMLQSILIIIPAIAVWALCGITYGIWGVFISLAGTACAFYLIFCFARKFDKKLLSKFVSEEKLENNMLTRSQHPMFTVAMCCLIPGLPLGIMPHLAGMTKVDKYHFLLAAIPTQLPNMFCYVYMGDKLISGDYTVAIVMAAVVVSISVVCWLFKKRIFAFFDKLAEKRSKNKKIA